MPFLMDCFETKCYSDILENGVYCKQIFKQLCGVQGISSHLVENN